MTHDGGHLLPADRNAEAERGYLEVVDRIEALVGEHRLALDSGVKACPEWTVRDLLGHLTGIAEDWRDGRFDGYASTEWTGAQVARHTGSEWSELRTAWRSAIAGLPSAAPHPQLGPPWRWLFGDALTHEADLRETADDATRPPDDAVLTGLAQMVGRWRHDMGAAGSAPSLRLTATGIRSWVIGADANPDAHVEADAYELWRALTGRRSLEAIHKFSWTGAPAGASAWFDRLPYPFRLPGADRDRSTRA